MSGTDPSRFRHDQSAYERPSTGYECGRARMWSAPCWQGPNVDGSCGGSAQCIPVKQGDRWECRRPKRAGGPCREGPLPDGSCAHTRPPCVPAPSMRRWRVRLTVLAALLTLAGLAAYANFAGGGVRAVAAIDPGPLSRAHQVFTVEEGCGACHRPHRSGVTGWLLAVVERDDQADACLDCHAFAGLGRLPHNREFENGDDLPEPDCRTCHTEHRGAEFSLRDVDNVKCGNCHEAPFTDFTDGHPPFPERFPYQTPNRINFDHARHLREYFVDPRFTSGRDAGFAERARDDCRVCHTVESATREVRPRSFAESCSGCHSNEIAESSLALYSPAEVTDFSGALLGLEVDDYYSAAGEDALRRFMRTLRDRGVDGLVTVLDASPLSPESTGTLLQGVSGSMLRESARAWLDDPYADPPDSNPGVRGGWQAGPDRQGFQSLRYVPLGHADPVMVAWLELLARRALDRGAAENVAFAAEIALDAAGGAGGCAKCHSAGIIAGMRDTGSGRWSLATSPERPHFNYLHAPHLRLLAPDAGCLECHRIDPAADYGAWYADPDWKFDPAEFASNFEAIDKETCTGCHNPRAIQDDCGTCHTYHLMPSFREAFHTRGDQHEQQD